MRFTTLYNLEQRVPAKIFERGKKYYKSGRVSHLNEWTTGHWDAKVEGSTTEYSVSAELDEDNVVDWECDCLYDDTNMCKHVVALLLTIKSQQKGPITRPTVTKEQRLLAAKEVIERWKNPQKLAEPQPVAPPPVLTPEEGLLAYEALPPTEQLFVKIAALIWEPFSQTKFIEIYNESGFRYEGINLYAKDAKRILEALYQKGLIQIDNNQYRCRPELSHRLCDRIWRRDTDFARIIPVIQRRMEISYWYGGSNTPERYFREMRFARYTDNPERFKAHYQTVLDRSDTYTPETLRAFWLGAPLDPVAAEALPQSICTFLLSGRLTEILYHLEPPDAYFEYTINHLEQVDAPNRLLLVQMLSAICLMRGDQPALLRVLAHSDSLTQAAVTGVQRLMHGQTEAALEAFTLAVKDQRKLTRSPKAILPGLYGYFHLLTYLKTNDPGYRAKIEETLNRMTKNSDPFSDSCIGLYGVLLFLQNQKAAAKRQFSHVPVAQLHRFFRFFSQYWVDDKWPDVVELSKLHKRAAANGYQWIQAETAALLEALEPGNAAQRQVLEKLQAELGIVSLVHLLPRIEVWENTLNALLHLGKQTQPQHNARENDARLIWLVDFERQQVQPKEQTFGKNGWSAGRNVAFQRLFKGEVACMTEHDRRVCRHISGWGSYYDIQAEKAIAELVGHPLLFLMKSPEIAVQFVEEKPVLIAKQVDEGFELRFSHDLQGEGNQVLKESPTRYKLLRVTTEQAKIAHALNGKSLFVPDRGAERLQEAVAGLSGIVTVQSALESDSEDLKTVAPDSRSCVHLLPVGDGFHLEIYAKPFSHTPPYFKPGEGEASVIALVEGQRLRATRDLKAEQKNLRTLRDNVPILRDNRPQHGIWLLEDAETCLELLLQLNPLVEAEDIILEWPKGEKFRISSVAGFDQFSLNVRERNNWFEVNGELRIDENKVLTMQELLQLSQQSKSQFVELSSGKFLALTNEFRRRLREINALMAMQKNGTLQLHPLAAAALQPFTDAVKNLTLDKAFQKNQTRLRDAFSRRFELPEGFNAQLRPYQQEGYEWLCRCADGGVGACLADDMGLGKTVQALALLVRRAALGPALVVAPASVCRNWTAETAKFAPSLRTMLFGEGDRAALIEQAGPGDVVVVTYDLMARESDHFVPKKFATIILDEAQAIKNRNTKRSETAMQLQGDFRMIMTGTPLENHLGELWNLFQFANAGLLGSIESFNERFAIPIEKFQDDGRRDQLRRLVQPFILRRRKNEVLKDLPAKTEITLTVELSSEERAFYEALRRQALASLMSDERAGGEKHLQILAEIMRLRRAACHPSLVDANAGFSDSSKLRLFGEIVEELLDNGHKALVFSQFVSHLSILEGYLKRKKITYQYLDGQTPPATRQKRIEAFQAGSGDLFLISLKAGGVGLNLTAADYVLHMDPWWNPAVEDQATDRAHRIGQEKPVTVYRLVAADTIEEKILKLHEQKRDLADSLLSGADMSAKLNAEELLALIAER